MGPVRLLSGRRVVAGRGPLYSVFPVVLRLVALPVVPVRVAQFQLRYGRGRRLANRGRKVKAGHPPQLESPQQRLSRGKEVLAVVLLWVGVWFVRFALQLLFPGGGRVARLLDVLRWALVAGVPVASPLPVRVYPFSKARPHGQLYDVLVRPLDPALLGAWLRDLPSAL